MFLYCYSRSLAGNKKPDVLVMGFWVTSKTLKYLSFVNLFITLHISTPSASGLE